MRQQSNEELPVLMPFSETIRKDEPTFLPFGLKAYLDLMDWTGRAKRVDKRGHTNSQQPKLLANFGLTGEQWQLLSLEIRKEAATMLH
ncbi:MAG: hypothetical protein RQ899_06365 [Pseudomonadales bacterium]|nr:hypothetical protein [Pseudomonadales bacterium]